MKLELHTNKTLQLVSQMYIYRHRQHAGIIITSLVIMPFEQTNKMYGISRANKEMATETNNLKRYEMSCKSRIGPSIR